MSVYDRWHTDKPTRFNDDGEPVTCEHRADDAPLYPSGVHKTGKRWQVRWRDPDGKQCKRNFDKKTGKNPNVHAEAFDKVVQGELATNAYIDPSAAEVTLAEFAKTWRASLTGKPQSLDVTDRRLAYIYDVPPAGKRRKAAHGSSLIGRKTMGELARRPQLVQDWIKDLERRGLSAQYIRQILNTLSSIFLVAIENGVVTSNPTRARSTVKRPRLEMRRREPWTMKQILLAAESLAACDPYLGGIPYLGAGAGLRGGEILGFAEEDIDRDEHVIRVRRQVMLRDGVLFYALPKRDKIRDVPLSGILDEQLDVQVRAAPPVSVTLPWGRPGGKPETFRLLFVRKNGLPYYPQLFKHQWLIVRAEVGVADEPEQGMHVLRHTFASACLADGVDIRTLADWLGHEDPGFTLRVYGHLMPSAAGRGRHAIDRFFSEES